MNEATNERTKPLISCLVHSLICALLASSCSRVKEPTKGPHVIQTETGVEMVSIPGGWFEMGSADGESDESPVHRVWIDPFLMDRYEVTQEQYVGPLDANPSTFPGPGRPVDSVNWADAVDYCNLRSRREGLSPCYDEETWDCDLGADGYRLPTEAEWEYACRAGTETGYSFGNIPGRLSRHAWFKGNSSKETHPVGRRRPNAWGLFDMHGNVAEWCNDAYDANYYKRSPARNPRGRQRGDIKVLRGGAWNYSADSCRSSSRTGENYREIDSCITDSTGFRCVRRPVPTEDAAEKPYNGM